MTRERVAGVCVMVLLVGGSVAGYDDPIGEKLDAAKKAYQAKVRAHREAVLELYQKVEERATAADKKKLLEDVDAERKRFLKDGAESKLFAPKLIDINSLRKSLSDAQESMGNSYQKAYSDYAAKGLKAEASVVKEEWDEFKIIESGRPRRFHVIGKALGGNYAFTRGNGAKAAITLGELRGAIAHDPDLKILNAAPRDNVRLAITAVEQLRGALANRNTKIEDLDKLLKEAQTRTDVATGVGNGNVRLIMKELRQRLAEPPELPEKRK